MFNLAPKIYCKCRKWSISRQQANKRFLLEMFVLWSCQCFITFQMCGTERLFTGEIRVLVGCEGGLKVGLGSHQWVCCLFGRDEPHPTHCLNTSYIVSQLSEHNAWDNHLSLCLLAILCAVLNAFVSREQWKRKFSCFWGICCYHEYSKITLENWNTACFE